MSKRLPVMERSGGTGGFVLQPRDVDLCRACWSYQGLTRTQLQQVVPFGTATAINGRLRALFDRGYLTRVRVASTQGGSLIVYLAGEKSVPYLGERDEHTSIRKIIRNEAQGSTLFRLHDLEVASLRISITNAIRDHSRLELEQWRNARECFHRYSANAVRPDGFLQVRSGDVLYSMFLEVDRGTVDLPRFKDKLRRYVEYVGCGAYTKRYGVERFRLAITSCSPQRLNSLRSAALEVTDRRCWFALTCDLIQQGDLTLPLWTSLRSTAAVPLVSSEA